MALNNLCLLHLIGCHEIALGSVMICWYGTLQPNQQLFLSNPIIGQVQFSHHSVVTQCIGKTTGPLTANVAQVQSLQCLLVHWPWHPFLPIGLYVFQCTTVTQYRGKMTSHTPLLFFLPSSSLPLWRLLKLHWEERSSKFSGNGSVWLP